MQLQEIESLASWPKRAGAVCGALVTLLGVTVLAGWTIPDQPLERTTAVCFVLLGIALWGMAAKHPNLAWIAGAVAPFLPFLSPAAVACCIVLAAGLLLARYSAVLGSAGVLVASMAGYCGIGAVWQASVAPGNLTRMAFPGAVAFCVLSVGCAVLALDKTETGFRSPLWAPIGAGLLMATIRFGLLQAFSPKHPSTVASVVAVLGALTGAAVFAIFTHLALKTYEQRDLLRAANIRLAQEMQTRERAGALEALNEELRHEIAHRESVQEDLRRQKEILQTIFDHIPVMINFRDTNFGVRLLNREWEHTLGWTLEELLTGNIDILEENYPDPAYREQVRAFVSKTSADWTDFKTTVRDGRVIDTSWLMLHLPNGISMGIGQDISARKRAEEALRESEERFRQLAENIQDLFWIKTPDFKRVLYVSPAYERVAGVSPEELYRETNCQSFLEAIVPEDRERMAEIVQRGAAQEYDIEFRVRRADGAVRWVRERGFPVRDASGRIYRLAGIAQDITDRKVADEALRESEERFRQLTENIREVFWLMTPDFQKVLYLSPGFESLVGERPGNRLQYTGLDPLAALTHPEDVQKVRESFPGRGLEFDIEYRIRRRDGLVRWIRVRGFPIRDAAGQVYRMGGVAEDITERKETEQRLKASSEQLRALSANLQSAREQEAKRIAEQVHDEVGGMLTGLRWELEALGKMIHEPGDLGPLKPAMQAKLGGMLELTDSTINVVRGIASELRPSILDDLGLAEAIEWQTQQFQARTGIRCAWECSCQASALDSSQSTALFRIVQEALTNILRHSQATAVHIAIQQEQQELMLVVSDNGRGITDAEKLSRTSLGLLGMRERAHIIGGAMEIAGVPGSGTTLEIRVPLGAAQPAEVA